MKLLPYSFFLCLAFSLPASGEFHLTYHPEKNIEPDDPALGLGFWSLRTGDVSYEVKPENTLVTYDTETEDARGGGGRYYRRQFTPEEFNDNTNLRIEADLSVEHSVGSLAATCIQFTTACGRTFGVGFVRDRACGHADRIVLYTDSGEPLETFHSYNTDWLWQVKELGSYIIPVNQKRTYILELLRKGPGPDDDIIRLTVEGASENPLTAKLLDLPVRAVVPGLILGHPTIHGGGQAAWYRIEISTTGNSSPPLPRRIGTARQLFLDDWMIESCENLARPVEKPVKYEGNPVIRREYPWETCRCDLYGSAVYDPLDKKVKLFYSAVTTPEHDDRLAYAESADGGRIWTKPLFDFIPFGEHSKTNLVFEPAGEMLAGPCVFLDSHDSDPARRYKLFTSDYHDRPDGKKAPWGMYVNTSPDGIRWNRQTYRCIDPLVSDTAQCAFWDERIQKYVAYVRFKPKRFGRAVGRMESSDFLHWSPPELVFVTEEKSFYSMGVTPYENLYIGTPWIFWDSKKDRSKTNPVLSPGLAVSRNSFDWHMLTSIENEEEFIPTGPPGSFDDRQIRMGSSLVVLENEILFLYGTSDWPHDSDMLVDVGLAILRLDGFRPLVAGDTPGILVTQPFILEADQLLLNASCKTDGSILTEILDQNNQPIPAFAANNAIPFTGDAIRHGVSWKQQSSLSSLRGQTIRLKFTLQNAKLYSFAIQSP